MKSYLYMFAIIICFALIVISCKNIGGGNTKSENEVDSISVTQSAKLEFPETSNAIKLNSFGKAKIYLENSESMKGYNNINNLQSNDFCTVVAALLKNDRKVDCYYYSNELSTSMSSVEFSNAIVTKSMRYGGSSPIDVICDKILTANESISFLITDGIMSGTDQEIRNYSRYNIDNAPFLRAKIAETVKKYRSNIAISIYQFMGNFNGTYFCYDNSKVKIEDKLRPYYVIVFGTQKDVKEFGTKVKANSIDGFNPNNNMHFGIEELPVSSPSMKLNGAGVENNGEITFKNPSSISKDITISILLDNVPELLIHNDNYIEENSVIDFFDSNENKKNVTYTSTYDSSSHTMRISFNKIFTNNLGSIKYTLKCTDPQWVNLFSTRDDKGIEMFIGDKTFNLEYLISAFKDGLYETSSLNIIECNYKIKN